MNSGIGQLYGVHDLSGNYVYKKNVEKMMNQHNKRLKEIKGRKIKSKVNEEVEHAARVHQNKKHIHEIQSQISKQHIERENKLLLQKLFEIQQQRKPGFDVGTKSQSLLDIKDSQKSLQPSNIPKTSLHNSYRKMEMQRIQKENLKIAEQIFKQRGCINIKGFEHDYKNHQKYSNNFRRLRDQKSRHRVGTLPPIDARTGKEVLNVSKSVEVTQRSQKDQEQPEPQAPVSPLTQNTESKQIYSAAQEVVDQAELESPIKQRMSQRPSIPESGRESQANRKPVKIAGRKKQASVEDLKSKVKLKSGVATSRDKKKAPAAKLI